MASVNVNNIYFRHIIYFNFILLCLKKEKFNTSSLIFLELPKSEFVFEVYGVFEFKSF